MMLRLCVLVAALVCCQASLSAAEKPNIVLIMCDDMGYSDIGCYGGEIETPNLDRLAAEGVRFTQFYNNAKCTTTRLSLITGMYPRGNNGGITLLRPGMVTIPEVLASAGYKSCLTGKWHLGNKAPHRPSDRGFDTYYGLLDGCCNFFDPSIPDPPFKGNRIRWFAHDDMRITDFPPEFYTTDAFTDYAVKFINETAPTEQPFFLHITYTAPHYPLHARPEDIAKYTGKYMIGWDELRRRRHQRQVEMGLIDAQWELPGPEAEVTPWEEQEHKEYHAELMAVYAAMIDRMDQNIGRVLATLEEQGIAENTVVMFLSDNGGCAEKPGGIDPNRPTGVKEAYTACGPGWAFAQNTPFRRYKQWAHEGGISTPFIVRWPGVVEANSMNDQVGHIIDLLPTCQEIAGAHAPLLRNEQVVPRSDGNSLVPLLKGDLWVGTNPLFWEWSGNRAVRDGEWKLAWDKKVKEWELYHIPSDRTEMHDLASEYPERAAELRAAWEGWAKRCGLPKKKR